MKAKRPLPQRSLKARALQCLAQREHSRAELRRKLLAHARAAAKAVDVAAAMATEGRAEAAAFGGAPDDDAAPADAPADAPAADPLAEVEAVLDWLEAHRYLSQERFVESRVHARAGRFGNLRIRQELKQHAVALTPEAAQALKASELGRARAVWSRRFAAPPLDAAERARHARFLAGRGFSPEVIRQLLRNTASAGDDDDDTSGGDADD